jgi:hypothetical protein
MNELAELAKMIDKDLDAGEMHQLVPAQGVDMREFHARLSEVIRFMLDHHFEKLCQVMYRLDVSEKKFHNVLTKAPSEEIAGGIADLVIERELQKIRTRELYRDRKL